jgi:bifunctional non-homologous end joining protein LigD
MLRRLAEKENSLSRSRQTPMPAHVRPMLAVLARELPADADHYGFEYKWDGVRGLCYWDGRRLTLESRNLLDITHRYPELQLLGKALGRRHSAILDGEILALDEMGRPSFARLQRRMHVEDPGAIARLRERVPVWYVLFDLLYLDGRSVMEEPLVERRGLLEELTVEGPSWQISPMEKGDGQAVLEAAKQQALEGVVAKRLDSTYRPGERSPAWRKLKVIAREEFVIGGWVPEGLSNQQRVGALLVGYYVPGEKKLRYAGGVGTGFSETWHRTLTGLLAQRARAASPFAGRVSKAGVVFVEPELIAEVEYRRWPAGGSLQQAAFKGLRFDKNPREVVAERACW